MLRPSRNNGKYKHALTKQWEAQRSLTGKDTVILTLHVLREAVGHCLDRAAHCHVPSL